MSSPDRTLPTVPSIWNSRQSPNFSGVLGRRVGIGALRDKAGRRAACHSHAAGSCSQLSKIPAYEEPAPWSAHRLPQSTQRYAPKTGSPGQRLEPASLRQHETLANVRVGSMLSKNDFAGLFRQD
jgi:hypothetical protein